LRRAWREKALARKLPEFPDELTSLIIISQFRYLSLVSAGAQFICRQRNEATESG